MNERLERMDKEMSEKIKLYQKEMRGQLAHNQNENQLRNV